MNKSEEQWDQILSSKKSFDLQLKQIWDYRDLLVLFIKRDIISFYKQTVFGPLWYFIQPIFTTIVYTFIFGKLAGLSTNGIPQPLFYMTGITAWNYYADCLSKTSNTFKDNASIFGKVYFPRAISPLSIIVSNLLRYLIQMILFIIILIYYIYHGFKFDLHWEILFLPLFILLMGMQGLGLGMIVTSMTTKYKDLSILLPFGIQIMMYATTVVYPLSALSGWSYWLVALNPITFIIEGIKFCSVGVGEFSLFTLLYSLISSLIIFSIGLLIFNKVEKSFIDTI